MKTNNIIFKVAIGVFLGISAWTNRAELGNVAFYGAMILIALFVTIYIYHSITTPIKQFISERQIASLVVELNKLGFLENILVGAAREGLNRFYFEATRKELIELLNQIKTKRSHELPCNIEEQRISELLSEIINDFKHSYRRN